MIGNRIADKIISISQKPVKESPKNDEAEEDVEISTHKKRYISPEIRQQIIDDLKLVPQNYWWTDVNKIVHV